MRRRDDPAGSGAGCSMCRRAPRRRQSRSSRPRTRFPARKPNSRAPAMATSARMPIHTSMPRRNEKSLRVIIATPIRPTLPRIGDACSAVDDAWLHHVCDVEHGREDQRLDDDECCKRRVLGVLRLDPVSDVRRTPAGQDECAEHQEPVVQHRRRDGGRDAGRKQVYRHGGESENCADDMGVALPDEVRPVLDRERRKRAPGN